jgi:hypothetical protein
MKAERFIIQACCKKTTLVFKTDRPIMLSDIEKLKKLGFKEAPQFTKAGLLYADNSDLIVSGPIGSDRLQVKCKLTDCEKIVNDFEVLLQQLG